MTCREVRGKLAEYAAGELPSSEQEQVETHVAQCVVCGREATALARCEGALSVLSALEKAPDLREDLRRRIAAPVPRRLGRAALAAIAGVALVVAVVLLWPRERTPGGAPPPAIVVKTPAPVHQDIPVPDQVEVSPPEPAVAAPQSSAPEAAEKPAVRRDRQAPPRALAVAAEPRRDDTRDDVIAPVEADQDMMLEVEPAVVVPAVEPRPAGGVVLVLGEPEPTRPASSCYLEVSTPEGERSVYETAVSPGAPRVIRMSCEQIASRPHDEGG